VSSTILQAGCPSCSYRASVEADRIFDFDSQCPECGDSLVLNADDDEDEGYAEHESLSPRWTSERPTQADREFDTPTRADAEDPYALAAQSLDPTLGTRPVPERFRDELEPSVELPAPLALSGLAAEEPPLPSWDGGNTQQVNELAEGEVGDQDHPPLDEVEVSAADLDDNEPLLLDEPLEDLPDTGDDLEADPSAADLGIPSMEVSDTVGRASRSYDRTPLLDAEKVAADGFRDPSGLSDIMGGISDEPQSAASAPEADPPTFEPEQVPLPPLESLTDKIAEDTARLFPADVDWLALLDETLSESEDEDEDESGEDEEGTGRYVIRVPKTAAERLKDPASVQRMQATLESSGAAALEELLLGGAKSDSRVVQRFDREPDEATKSFVIPDEEEPGPTGAFSRREVGDVTRNWGGGPEPPTLPMAPEPEAPQLSAAMRRRTINEFRPEDLDPALVCAHSVNSAEAEHFRQLYQRVFRSQNGESPQMVLVTSARAGEGKTTVAGNLAIVGARIPGGGALLIDADARGQGVMRAFGQRSTTEGLLEALLTDQDPTRFVLRFKMKELDVIPLGLHGSDAVDLIASSTMQDFLDNVRLAYPHQAILIDSPAVLDSADPLDLARRVDKVVLVVRAGVTSRQDVERALDMLGREKVLGVVLNDAVVGAV
jgi:protein-tyrosine kinase